MTALDDQLIGSFAGNFQIRALIGSGGMARVYAAQHPTLGKNAAIKVLSHELAHNSELVQRFVVEAQAVARLNHPNIVEISDFGTLPDGRPFYVMEQLAGETLQAYLQRVGPLDVATLAAILEPVLGALEAAHYAGIVHRDLKPDNIFLALRGDSYVPKLLDFGIAKMIVADVTSQTAVGSLLGTPAYMSPEQASGQIHQVSVRSDIYAVGVLGYEMLTGKPPFVSLHLGELILQHLTVEPKPLTVLRPDVPAVLCAHLHQCLEKDPIARPASVGPLRTLLRSLANPHTIGAQIGTSLPPPAHLPMGTPVFRHDANVDSNGQTLDGSAPRIPAHIDVNGRTVDASGPIPAIGRPAIRPDTLPVAVAATALAPALSPTPAPTNRTLTLGGHAAVVKRAELTPPPEPMTADAPPQIFATGAAQVPPATLSTRKSGQGVVWAAAFAATVLAGVVVFFAVRAIMSQNQHTAQPILAGVNNASPPTVIAQVPPTVTAMLPNNTAAPVGSPDEKILPRAAPDFKPLEPRDSVAPNPVRAASQHKHDRNVVTSNQLANGNVATKAPATPSTPIATPAVGSNGAAPALPVDDENPAYVALVREVTDAAYAKDYVRGLAAAEKGLLLRPGDASLLFQAVLMACQTNNAAAAKRNFAAIRDAQSRAGIEQACIAFSDIELTPETKYTAAYKAKKATGLYMQGVKATKAGDHAAAAKLHEQSFEQNSGKSNDAAAWQGAMAACRVSNVALVKKFWPHVAARFQADVIEACQKADVVIPGIVEPAPL
ncbi:MAG: protein kinase [Kofleriaceae bacterium]|nr:protein kinase [Kofleriaceae bacterium]